MAGGLVEWILRLRTEGADALRGVAKDADAAADATRRADAAAEDYGDAAGRVGEGAGKLAQGLGLVDERAAAVAQGVADVADVLEVAAAASSAGGLAMGVLGGALVAAAAAAAPLAGHLLVLSREQEEAAARAQFLADHLHDLDEATRQYEDAVLAAAVATGRLSEEQARLQAIQDGANRAVADFRTSQEEQRREAEASFFANERYLRGLDVLPEFLSTAIDYYGGFSSAQAEARFQLDELDRIEGQHQETIARTVDEQIRATNATQRATAARQGSAAATREEAEAARYLAEQQRMAAEMATEAEQALAAQAAAMAGLRQMELLGATDAERANALADERVAKALEFYEVTRDTLALEQALAGIEADRSEALQAAFNAQAQANTTTSRGAAGVTGDTLSTVAGAVSDPLSAIATAGGPIAAGVIAAVQAVSDLGGTLNGLRDLLGSVADNLANGGKALAGFVADAIGEFVPAILGAVDDFVLGFIGGIPEILRGIAEGLPQLAVSFLQLFSPLAAVLAVEIGFTLIDVLTDPQTWVRVGQSFADGVIDALLGVADSFAGAVDGVLGTGATAGAANDIAGFFSDLFAGSFATGTDFVPRTGLALVHQGERIVPAAGTSSGTTAGMMGGGGGVVINLPAGLLWGVPRDFAREVERVADRGIRWGM